MDAMMVTVGLVPAIGIGGLGGTGSAFTVDAAEGECVSHGEKRHVGDVSGDPDHGTAGTPLL